MKLEVKEVNEQGNYFDPTSLEFIKVVSDVCLAVQVTIASNCLTMKYGNSSEVDKIIQQSFSKSGIDISLDYNMQFNIGRVLINMVVLPTMRKVGENENVVLMHSNGELAFAGNKEYVTKNVLNNSEYMYLDEVRHNLFIGQVNDLHKRELLNALSQMGKMSVHVIQRYYNDDRTEIKFPYFGTNGMVFNIETQQMQIKSDVMLLQYRGKKKSLLNTLNEELLLEPKHTLSLEKYDSGRYKDNIYCTSTYDYYKDGYVTKESILDMIAEHEKVVKKVNELIN